MDLELFLRKDSLEGEEVEYPASSAFMDEDGNVISWRIRRLSVDEVEELRKSCIVMDSAYGACFNSMLFNRRLAAMSVIEPNLNSALLQDSYGVKKPEELITKLFATIGEYDDFIRYIAGLNGFALVGEQVDEAKN
jgi:hypothetical protein